MTVELWVLELLLLWLLKLLLVVAVLFAVVFACGPIHTALLLRACSVRTLVAVSRFFPIIAARIRENVCLPLYQHCLQGSFLLQKGRRELGSGHCES